MIPSPQLLGLAVALAGRAIRCGTIGPDDIIRGGKDHQVYAERLVAVAVVTIANVALAGTLAQHVFVVTLMALVIVARIGLHLAARALRARDEPAAAGR